MDITKSSETAKVHKKKNRKRKAQKKGQRPNTKPQKKNSKGTNLPQKKKYHQPEPSWAYCLMDSEVSDSSLMLQTDI
jgi:hypothetical protein